MMSRVNGSLRRGSSAPLAQEPPHARPTGAEGPRARDDAAARARERLEVPRRRSCDTHDDDARRPIMVIDPWVQPPEADLAGRGERALPDDARDALGVVHLRASSDEGEVAVLRQGAGHPFASTGVRRVLVLQCGPQRDGPCLSDAPEQSASVLLTNASPA